MTTFNHVDPRKLTLGKTYLVLEKIQNKSIYIFKGKIEKLINNTFDTNDEIVFSTISSIFMKNHKKNYSVYSFDATFYEYIHTKPKIQKNMEDRTLIDIMRNIIGDETFNYPLFHKESNVSNMADIQLVEINPTYESYYTDESDDEDEIDDDEDENEYRIKISNIIPDAELDIIIIE